MTNMQPAPQPHQQPMQQQPVQQQQPMQQQPQQAAVAPAANAAAPNPFAGGFDPFANAGTVEVKGGFSSTPYPEPGDYWYLVNAVKMKAKSAEQQHKPHNVTMIWEFTVIHCIDPDSTHKVGQDVSTIFQDSKAYFIADVKRLVGMAMGKDPNTVTPQEMHAACQDHQPLAGAVIRNKVEKVTKKDGSGTYNASRWQGWVDPSIIQQTLSPDVMQRFFGGQPAAAQQPMQQPQMQPPPQQ